MAVTLSFPAKMFHKHFAFALDYGSSVIKLIYATAEGDEIHFSFTSFSRDQPDEAIQFIKKTWAGRLEPGSLIYTTGVGVATYASDIEEALDVKLESTSELHSIVDGFMFLGKYLPWDSLVHPCSQKALEYAKRAAEGFADLYKSHATNGRLKLWESMDNGATKTPMDDALNEVCYPTLVIHIGSCMSPFLINEDGTYTFCAFSPVCGKTFLGLGNMLAQTESFQELYELAERGETGNVDQLYNDSGASDHDHMYNKCSGVDLKVFAFGHAVQNNNDELRREDKAAALMSMLAQIVATESHFWAAHYKVKQVFFTGGFGAMGDKIRELISVEFAYRNTTCLNHRSDYYFVKHASYTCGLGALLKTLVVT